MFGQVRTGSHGRIHVPLSTNPPPIFSISPCIPSLRLHRLTERKHPSDLHQSTTTTTTAHSFRSSPPPRAHAGTCRLTTTTTPGTWGDVVVDRGPWTVENPRPATLSIARPGRSLSYPSLSLLCVSEWLLPFGIARAWGPDRANGPSASSRLQRLSANPSSRLPIQRIRRRPLAPPAWAILSVSSPPACQSPIIPTS